MLRLRLTVVAQTLGIACLVTALGCESSRESGLGSGAGSSGETGTASAIHVDLTTLDPAVATALEAARDDVTRDERSAAAWSRFARTLHAHDLIGDAETAYLEALASGAGEEDRYLLAVVQSELGRDIEASGHLALVFQSTGYEPAAYRLAQSAILAGRAADAELCLDRLISGSAVDPHAARLRARARLTAGDAAGARSELERLLAVRPNDRYARFLLASADRRLGITTAGDPPPPIRMPDWDDPWLAALDDLRVGYRREFELAAAEIATDPASAVERLEGLRSERPESINILVNLGIAHQRTGDLDRAYEVLDEAVNRRPERELPRLQLAVTCGLLAKRDGDPDRLERGLEHARELVARDPESGRAHALVAELELAADRPGRALEAYRRASELGPAFATPYARLLAAHGRWSDVMRTLEPLPATGHSAESLFLLGAARINTGDLVGGRKTLEQALTVDPRHEPARRALARLDAP